MKASYRLQFTPVDKSGYRVENWLGQHDNIFVVATSSDEAVKKGEQAYKKIHGKELRKLKVKAHRFELVMFRREHTIHVG